MSDSDDFMSDEFNRKKARELLENENIVEAIMDITKGMVESKAREIIESLIYGQASVYAPDLDYTTKVGLKRTKRPQESTFVFGTGSIGIDTTWSICRNFFINFEEVSYVTMGALTAFTDNYAKQIDHKMTYFAEFNTAKPALISQIKTILEENRVKAVRSIGGGIATQVTDVLTAPALYIGANYIPQVFDNPFLSRFDNFFRIFGSKQMWKDITDVQGKNIGNSQHILNSNTTNEMEKYKDCFMLLKEINSKKEKVYRKNYENIIVSFDEIRDKWLESKDKILDDLEGKESLFPRDTEIGLRRINSSAWLNIFKREYFIENKILFIKANEEDLKAGIESLERSVTEKSKFFEWRAEQRKISQEARKAFISLAGELKNLSLREQAQKLTEAGHTVSHMTVKRWRDEEKV